MHPSREAVATIARVKPGLTHEMALTLADLADAEEAMYVAAEALAWAINRSHDEETLAYGMDVIHNESPDQHAAFDQSNPGWRTAG